MAKTAKFKKFLLAVYRGWREHELMERSAALAFYLFLALPALLMILSVIGGLTLNSLNLAERLTSQAAGLFGPQVAKIISYTLDHLPELNFLNYKTWISLVLFLMTASGIFAQLQKSLNESWQAKPAPPLKLKSFIKNRLLLFLMLLFFGLILLASFVLDLILNQFNSSWWKILNQLASLGLLIFLLAIIYRYLPRQKLKWKDIWLGATVTAALLLAGKLLISLYLNQAKIGTAFGAAGSTVIFLAWVYYSSLSFFLGAEITYQLARFVGSKKSFF